MLTMFTLHVWGHEAIFPSWVTTDYTLLRFSSILLGGTCAGVGETRLPGGSPPAAGYVSPMYHFALYQTR